MARRTLAPNPGEVVLEHLKLDGPDQLVMVLRAAGKGQTCPVCQRRTAKIHSRYRRHLSDLPWLCQRYSKNPQNRRMKNPQEEPSTGILASGGPGCCDWRDSWRYRSCTPMG